MDEAIEANCDRDKRGSWEREPQYVSFIPDFELAFLVAHGA